MEGLTVGHCNEIKEIVSFFDKRRADGKPIEDLCAYIYPFLTAILNYLRFKFCNELGGEAGLLEAFD